MHERIERNKRQALLLVGVFTAVIALILGVLSLLVGGGFIGLIIALVIAGTTALVGYRKSDSLVLAMSRAEPADENTHARLHNLVEGLCIAGGLPKPRLYVIDDAAPNAFATGRNPAHAAIAVTTGLLEKMNRVELEGVLAHELSHIKNHDILVSTMAAIMIGSGFALRIFDPLIARMMHAMVPSNREELADVTGVGLTRYPPGLISALEKLEDDRTVVHGSRRATAHLWIEQPTDRKSDTDPSSTSNDHLDTHPPLEERIEVLREL